MTMETLAAAALAALVACCMASLWRLGSVLVGLPAALNGIRAICTEHDKRLTRLENVHMNGAPA